MPRLGLITGVRRFLVSLLFALCLVAGCGKPVAPPVGVRTSELTLPASEGEARGVVFTPPGGAPPGVLVLHGDAGLDDAIRAHARRLADQGYLVLALDLYRGDAPDPKAALPDARVRGDLKAAVDWLTEQSAEENRSVGVIGWELGGGYALDAAIADPRIAACVVCYGRLTSDPAKLSKMNASVLAVFAGKDASISPEARLAFSQALTKTKKLYLKPLLFRECDRGFMNPTADRQASAKDDASSREAWRHIDALFREKLRP